MWDQDIKNLWKPGRFKRASPALYYVKRPKAASLFAALATRHGSNPFNQALKMKCHNCYKGQKMPVGIYCRKLGQYLTNTGAMKATSKICNIGAGL